MGYMNGDSAKTAIRGALALLGLLIVCITFIVVQENTVPPEFFAITTTLVGAIVGFLVGTRVVPPDISAQIKTEPLNKAEVEILAAKDDK